MKIYTQDKSEKRIAHDNLGDDALKELYNNYNNMDLFTFKKYCKELINKGTGTNKVKLSFCCSIDSDSTKEKTLTRTQNYILAGMGLGV